MIKSHTGCYAWGGFFVSSGRKLRSGVVHTDSHFRYAALLRYCTDYAFGFSRLDETVETRLPWRGSPCLAFHGKSFLCFMGIILQYLNSFAMRSHEGTCAPPSGRGLRPLRCDWNPLRRELRVAHCCNRQQFYPRLASTRLRWDKIRKD